ncbi:hypothetical protein SAMN06264346_12020 [Chryseobacterium profundimaris]|uniref:Uncharacterized protein n=1 Tax=Chryseobacterium profundimaris TaxID=1387275 RepID=A0ABY1PJ52_9FLAO|nr:hypothetical protein SAMN06264346_12020 [Chryseobacterium profundimaris]
MGEPSKNERLYQFLIIEFIVLVKNTYCYFTAGSYYNLLFKKLTHT